jgi:hypothetical protein
MTNQTLRKKENRVFRIVHDITGDQPRWDWPKVRVSGAVARIKVKIVTTN